MPEPTTMKELLEAGVHFGHQTRRWNPKMKPFIFTARNGIHILDLSQTVDRITAAEAFVRESAAAGREVLFVGTKKQAQEVVRAEAERAEMPYIVNRWLGGTLTNWQTIQARIDHMLRLEQQEATGQFELLPKREALKRHEEIERLRRYLGGLRHMTRLPGVMFIIDVPKEDLAVKEAVRLGIPIVAVCDTNADPTGVAYPIPSNDDAIRAIRLITTRITDAILEGRTERQSSSEEAEAEAVGVG